MSRKIKHRVRQLINAAGLEIHRYVPASSRLAQHLAALKTFGIDLVLDVGANYGQYAQELRIGGFKGRIVSFEPLLAAHHALEVASRGDPRWKIHSRCAIGDREGEIALNVAGNSVSSSVLPMLESHREAAPGSAYVSHEVVPLTTLDNVVPAYISAQDTPLLKIDTQGYEWAVLDGAFATLPKIQGVQVELSALPLYEGQHLWQETIARLQGEGFTLWSLQPAFTDHRSGRTLQWDGLFFRQ